MRYFKFRLYVAGHTPNSQQAMTNLKTLCRMYLHRQHEIEIVDVFREPKLALADGILMTPMLVRLVPSPSVKIVGTLGQTESVLQALGLENIAS